MKYTYHIRPSAAILALSVFFMLCFVSTIQAAAMPVYERFPPITAALIAPTAVALDASENVYVTESSNNRLLVFDHGGRYLKTLAGLDKPISVAVSGDGRIFVGNDGRGSVEVYNTDLAPLRKLGSGDGEFIKPGAIAVDSAGNVYVADSKDDKIKVYSPDGPHKFSFGSSGSADGQFKFPASIFINGQSEEIIISDLSTEQSDTGPYQGARIQVFGMDGRFRRSFGSFGVGGGKLVKPLGMAVGEDGRVYVTDAYQNVVQVFDSSGTFLGTIYDQENPMRTPLGIAFGKKTSRLFIASLNTAKVEVYGIGVHAITAGAVSGGTISPSGTVFVKHGGSQTFAITPDGSHQVADVVADGSSAGIVTAYTFTDVTASHTIEVAFTPVDTGPDIESSDIGQEAGYPGATSWFRTASTPALFIAGLLVLIGVAAVIKRRAILG